MIEPSCALSREVTIVNELGLHARSAAKIAQLAQEARAGVWIRKGDETADATSIIDILTFACVRGTRLMVCVDEPEDQAVLERIVTLVENGFGE